VWQKTAEFVDLVADFQQFPSSAAESPSRGYDLPRPRLQDNTNHTQHQLSNNCCFRLVLKTIFKYILKQNCQALLKIKYCLQKPLHKAQKPIWPWPFTYDLDIQQVSRGCQGRCYSKCHQAKCNGSRVTTLTQKNKQKNWATVLKTILSSLP